jgi:hypothetical protein
MGAGKSLCAAAVVAVLLMLFGCGNSDSSSGELSKAEFVKQATAICNGWQKGREEALGVAAKRFAGQNSAKAKEEAVFLTLHPYEEATRKLGELDPPEAQATEAEAMVRAMEDAIRKVKADPLTALETANQFEQANERAEKAGLKSCKA